MKSLRIFSALVSVAYICFLVSCTPEGIKPTPGSYIINGPQDVEPAFSPDGNFIAYAHLYDTAKSYPNGLYIIDKNGNNRKLVLAGFHFGPAWSPDGQWLAFTSGGTLKKCKKDGSQLIVFGGLSQLKESVFYYPAWTSDGKLILFDNPTEAGGLFETSSDFVNAKRFFWSDQWIRRNPEPSPDRSQIIFLRGAPEDKNWEVYKADTLKLIEIRLTQNNRDDRAPTWSPDGFRIAWSSSNKLSIMNSDGSNQIEIDYGSDPSWSINNEIVYSHANADYSKEVLYIISPDGKNKRQVTQ